MLSHYPKRAFKILREDGLVGLSVATLSFARSLLATNSDLWWEYEKQKVQQKITDETDADPLKTIWVDPNEIQRGTGQIECRPGQDWYHLQYFDRNFRDEPFGTVQNGSWDINTDTFTEVWEFRGLREWHVEDVPWEHTDFFKKYMETIRDRGRIYGCKSRNELLEKCFKYESMFENIDNKGYKTQRELGKINPLREIQVNIGRDGEFLFDNDGRHRLSIAKVLELEEIPVIVKARHTVWQQLRDNISQNGLSEEHDEELRHHPDLQDIFD